MTPQQRDAVLARLMEEARAPSNGFPEAVARIRAFEDRYEMTSAELVVRLSDGRQKETAEVAQWLFWLSVLKHSAR
jgi:hypothetical protein